MQLCIILAFFHDISRTQSFHEIRDFIFRLCSSLAIGIAQSLGFLFASAYTLMRVMSSESESAPCCSSTLSSEHELTESTSGTKGSGLPMRKKRKITSGPGRKFKASSLPLARRESNERGDSVKLLN